MKERGSDHILPVPSLRSSKQSKSPSPIPSKSQVRKITINVSHTQYDLIRSIASSLNWRLSTRSDSTDWDILWSDSAVPPDTLSKMRPYQKINHFPGMYMLSRKNFLAKNLNKMKKLHPSDYNFYPKTWILPSEYADLRASPPKVAIVKPEASSQGKGIFLTKNTEELSPSDRYVVQEYVKHPLLIDGHKFDIRLYVLVNGCNPLRAYLHKEGLVRLATKPYEVPNASNLAEQYMHLTNYAINRTNKSYDKKGHKRSLSSTLSYLNNEGYDTDALWGKIQSIVAKTLCCIQPSLSHTYRACQPGDFSNSMCFEILGFDVLVDRDLNPWLLEVNHSPSFRADSSLDQKVKSSVVKDALALLNINLNLRLDYKAFRRQELIMKAFPRNKEEEREKRNMDKLEALQKREEWENSHQGGYLPLFHSESFEVFLKSANDIWQKWTGVKVRLSETPRYSHPTHIDLNTSIFGRNRRQILSKQFPHIKLDESTHHMPEIPRQYSPVLREVEKKVLENIKRNLMYEQPLSIHSFSTRRRATETIDILSFSQKFPNITFKGLVHRGALNKIF